MQITTEKDYIDTLKKLGVEKGSVVLVQANLLNQKFIVNQEQTLIDALKKVVTEDGCIIVPTFNLNCLDPASYEMRDISYEDWDVFRADHNGFDPALSICSEYTRFSEQFLKNKGVQRTEHPVYSFAFWGNYDEKCLEQPLHLPVSFGRVLREFVHRDSYNLLIDEKIEKSLLFTALAKTMNMGVLTEKKAIIKKGKMTKIKSFLNLELDQETIEQCLKLCWIEKDECQKIQILSLDTSEDNS